MTFKNVYFQGSPRERASAGGGGVVRQRKAPSGKTLQKQLHYGTFQNKIFFSQSFTENFLH